MASTNNAFMEEHKDFVLKLKFVGEGDTSQVRRVRLPRVLDCHGQLSYDELCGLAISFVIPENPGNASDFEVKLTYKDVDDDMIVIGSSEELLDAIEQFSEQRVLRISAEVKRFRKATALQPPSSAASPETHPSSQASQDARVGIGGSANGAAANSSSTTRNHSEPVPVLQNVVESVVNIILNAAVAINGRQGSQSATSPPAPVFYTPEGVPAEATESGATDQSPLQEPVTPSTPSEASQTKPEEAKDTAEETSAPATAATENVEEERPFIHGRHTCDICLTTPIIGKRFHAQNMSDYDLCEKCHNNYSGAEIQFEAVELERDRSLQARWHRRRQRQSNARGPGAGGRLRFGPKGWGPPPHRRGDNQPPPSFPPPPPAGPFGPHRPGPLFGPPHGPRFGHGPPFGPPHHQRGHPPFGPPPHLPHGPPPAAGNDLAMEEAIRRSLRDIIQNVENDAAKPEPSAEVSSPPAPVMDEVASLNTKDIEAVQKVGSLKPAPQPSAPLEEEVRSLSSIGSVASGSNTEGVKVETVEDENGEEGGEEDDEQKGDDMMDIETPRAEEPSFSSDAAGSGDVAVSLGETLDKCAEAIDAMVLELERTGSGSTHSSFVGVSKAGDEESSVEAEETEGDAGGEESTAEAEVTEGATIVESADGANPDDTSNIEDAQVDGGEDWQVVNEDQQTSSDEDIARAAQMIGSALFNSDMRSSHEMMSTLTAGSSRAGDEASFASSVPTDLPSVSSLSHAQLDRWALQLSQLHDMGIDDDKKCIDILEKLAAANIGCGNDDEEVSVQKVLDEMWKN